MSPIHVSLIIASPFIFRPVVLVMSRPPGVSNSFAPPCSKKFVSHSGWSCPAFRMSPIHLYPLIATHLSPSVAGGVDVSKFICPPYGNSFVSQFGCWCPAVDVSNSIVSLYSNSYVSVAGGVWLSGCGLPVASKVSQLLPSLLHLLSSLRPVSQTWSPSCFLDVSQMRWPKCCLPVAPKLSRLVGESSSCRKMWSPSCLPHVVSQVLSPSCCQRFYTYCVVLHLFRRCGFLDVVSQSGGFGLFSVFLQMWSPCCLLDVSQMWFPSCLTDVVPQLSHRCGS